MRFFDRFQLVWWWKYKGFKALLRLPFSVGPYPQRGCYAGSIYKWRVVVGPLEIRRWADKVLAREPARCWGGSIRR